MGLIDKKFIQNVRLNYLAQIINVGLGFVYVSLVVKFAGISVYGSMTIILSVGATILNLISFRTNEVLVKFYRRGMIGNSAEIKYFSVVCGLILDAITGALVILIIQIFSNEIAVNLINNANDDGTKAIVLSSYIIAAGLIRGTGYGLLIVKEIFILQNILAVLEQFAKVLGVMLVFYAVEKPNLSDIMQLLLIVSISFSIVYLLVALKELVFMPKRRWGRLGWLKAYWAFSSSTFLSSSLKSGHKNLDVIIIGYFSNSSTVGVFNLFKQFISPLDMLTAPYVLQIYPRILDAFNAKEFGGIGYEIKNGCKALFIQGISIMLIISPCVIYYFHWSNISISLIDGLAFLTMLSSAFILQGLWWTRSFSLAKRPELSIVANGIAFLLTIFVMPVLIIIFGGILGAALSFLVSSVLLAIFWIKEFMKVAAHV